MKIRRAKPDDADALARVNINSWRSAYRGLVTDTHLESLDYGRLSRRFRKDLACPCDEETYVAEEADEVLGFVTLGACRDPDVDQATTGEIWGIYLGPQHWRKGVGRRLCQSAEQMLTSEHYRQAILWVFEGNNSARRFYEAMGFKADGASKTLNVGGPLKAIRYRKKLRLADPALHRMAALRHRLAVREPRRGRHR
jgi:GNAT superfamily N-acetyltransferase